MKYRILCAAIAISIFAIFVFRWKNSMQDQPNLGSGSLERVATSMSVDDLASELRIPRFVVKSNPDLHLWPSGITIRPTSKLDFHIFSKVLLPSEGTRIVVITDVSGRLQNIELKISSFQINRYKEGFLYTIESPFTLNDFPLGESKLAATLYCFDEKVLFSSYTINCRRLFI